MEITFIEKINFLSPKMKSFSSIKTTMSVSLSDIMHIMSTAIIFGILTLYTTGEWKIYIISFAVLYIMYYIYSIYGERSKSKFKMKNQNKTKNVLKMLKLDVVNLIKPIF
jgi:hypothetical protein